MPNVLKALTAAMILLGGLGGCHGKQDQQPNAPADPNIVGIDNDAATPTVVEALPSDESSATPSNQLVNGDDSPDVNAGGDVNSD